MGWIVLKYRAIPLLLLDHLSAVFQGGPEVAKLCIGSGSIIEDTERGVCISID